MSAVPADAVLFDLDGCLVDSRVPFTRSVNAALVEHGLAPRPDEELHGYLGPPIHATFRGMVGDERLVQSLVDAYRRRYRERAAAETPVFAGVPEVVVGLARRVPLVVATSKPHALAEPLLRALGLRDHFRAVVGPDLAAVDEPKTATVERALAHVRDHRRVVMVGDRRFDVEAARRHGLRSVGVLWGIGSAGELRAAGADVLVDHPSELPAAIDGSASAVTA